MPSREPVVPYLHTHAELLRRQRATAPAAAPRLDVHADALDLLADLVRTLPDDDERLLMLRTLAVREGRFEPGAGAEHALNQFAGVSSQECDAFLSNLVRIVRDDALARARAHGHLPPPPNRPH
jgi:hypothetical protein